MGNSKLLKMNVEYHLTGCVIKDPSVPVNRDTLFSEFLNEQLKSIFKFMKCEIVTFEVFTSDFRKLAVIDNNKSLLFIDDDTIEVIKREGIGKLKFHFVGDVSVETHMADEKDILNIIDGHESFVDELNKN